MKLVQMVPGIAPLVDGIGDYALQLARQLRDRHGIVTTFLVGDPAWRGEALIEGFPVFALSDRTASAFLAGLQENEARQHGDRFPLLIHFSPYGYEKRGCPFWLADALEQYAKLHPASVNACFHELERTGAPPWSSGFYVPPFQRAILLRLARISNFRYTNTEFHRRKLEAWGAGRFALIPNFSTISEPLALPPMTARRNDIVVFGRDHHRQLTYQRAGDVLLSVCKRLGFKRIVDIGKPIPGHDTPALGDIPILRCGRLEEAEVGKWMASSLASFMHYPVQYLTKSSVHAVASAHGTITLLHDDSPKEVSCPGLETGVDFVPVLRNASALDLPDWETLCTAVYSSYQNRASWAAADRLAQHLQTSWQKQIRGEIAE